MKLKGFCAVTLAIAAIPLIARPAGAQTTVRIPASPVPQPNGPAGRPSISSDGRYIAFESNATNLVSGDTNGATDIYVYDTQTGDVKRASVSSAGAGADRDSFFPSISADGRYVAFESFATDLVANDTNDMVDVFVHDLQTGATVRASVASDGTPGDQGSDHPAISADGKWVAFESAATNLVANDTNKSVDTFVHNLESGATARVSVDAAGGEGTLGGGGRPAISADGRYVAFGSLSPNLADGDTNGKVDIFVHDTVSGSTTRVSVPNAGGAADGLSTMPAISADGRYVAFYSAATNLVSGDTDGIADIFLADTQTGNITLVGAAGDANPWPVGALTPAISADGKFVAWSSAVGNTALGVASGNLQVYLYDVSTGATTLVSVTPADKPGDSHSWVPAIDQDGAKIAFASVADDLVTGDTNGQVDIFVRGPSAPAGFTLADAADALRIAGGLKTATAGDVTRFGGPVTLATAVTVARSATGTAH